MVASTRFELAFTCLKGRRLLHFAYDAMAVPGGFEPPPHGVTVRWATITRRYNGPGLWIRTTSLLVQSQALQPLELDRNCASRRLVQRRGPLQRTRRLYPGVIFTHPFGHSLAARTGFEPVLSPA